MHQVKLVINAREDLCDGGGVGDHTAGAHDFGQISARYHSGWPQLKICASRVAYDIVWPKWLIVDAALEASWTPVNKLNGTLGLDSGHGCVHILGHHVASLNNSWQKNQVQKPKLLQPILHYFNQLLIYFRSPKTYPNLSSPLVSPSFRGTSCSRPCTCHDEDRTSPSSRLVRRRTWWFPRPTTVHGRPSQQRSLVRRRSTWSGCAGRAPNWFGIWQPRESSIHGINQWCDQSMPPHKIWDLLCRYIIIINHIWLLDHLQVQL